VYTDTAETTDELARFVAHHQPFYEALHALRLDITTNEASSDLRARRRSP
jgi:hypothetical protein